LSQDSLSPNSPSRFQTKGCKGAENKKPEQGM
jgi:hypothetical protein